MVELRDQGKPIDSMLRTCKKLVRRKRKHPKKWTLCNNFEEAHAIRSKVLDSQAALEDMDIDEHLLDSMRQLSRVLHMIVVDGQSELEVRQRTVEGPVQVAGIKPEMMLRKHYAVRVLYRGYIEGYITAEVFDRLLRVPTALALVCICPGRIKECTKRGFRKMIARRQDLQRVVYYKNITDQSSEFGLNRIDYLCKKESDTYSRYVGLKPISRVDVEAPPWLRDCVRVFVCAPFLGIKKVSFTELLDEYMHDYRQRADGEAESCILETTEESSPRENFNDLN